MILKKQRIILRLGLAWTILTLHKSFCQDAWPLLVNPRLFPTFGHFVILRSREYFGTLSFLPFVRRNSPGEASVATTLLGTEALSQCSLANAPATPALSPLGDLGLFVQSPFLPLDLSSRPIRFRLLPSSPSRVVGESLETRQSSCPADPRAAEKRGEKRTRPSQQSTLRAGVGLESYGEVAET